MTLTNILSSCQEPKANFPTVILKEICGIKQKYHFYLCPLIWFLNFDLKKNKIAKKYKNTIV